jgi:hypothetical protein
MLKNETKVFEHGFLISSSLKNETSYEDSFCIYEATSLKNETEVFEHDFLISSSFKNETSLEHDFLISSSLKNETSCEDSFLRLCGDLVKK